MIWKRSWEFPGREPPRERWSHDRNTSQERVAPSSPSRRPHGRGLGGAESPTPLSVSQIDRDDPSPASSRAPRGSASGAPARGAAAFRFQASGSPSLHSVAQAIRVDASPCPNAQGFAPPSLAAPGTPALHALEEAFRVDASSRSDAQGFDPPSHADPPCFHSPPFVHAARLAPSTADAFTLLPQGGGGGQESPLIVTIDWTSAQDDASRIVFVVTESDDPSDDATDGQPRPQAATSRELSVSVHGSFGTVQIGSDQDLGASLHSQAFTALSPHAIDHEAWQRVPVARGGTFDPSSPGKRSRQVPLLAPDSVLAAVAARSSLRSRSRVRA